MKKSLFVSVMALVLVLCLSSCAAAQAMPAFSFTAQQFMDTCVLAENKSIGCIVAPGSYTLQLEGSGPIVLAVDADGLCTAMSTWVSIPLGQSTGDTSAALGEAAYRMMYITRCVELGIDHEQLTGEMEEMMNGFQVLMDSFTDEDHETFVDAPVVKQMEICGHTAAVVLSFDVLQMAVVMTFSYMA